MNFGNASIRRSCMLSISQLREMTNRKSIFPAHPVGCRLPRSAPPTSSINAVVPVPVGFVDELNSGPSPVTPDGPPLVDELWPVELAGMPDPVPLPNDTVAR